jgi:hypothetical protein
MACMMPEPPLDSDKIYELESHGVDSVRARPTHRVSSASRAFSRSNRNFSISRLL